VNDEKGKVFDIVIQLGAILAVCWEYRARFARAFSGPGDGSRAAALRRQPRRGLRPAAAVGFLSPVADQEYLFNPTSVAIALIVGAIVIFAVERWVRGATASRA
jgi:undecaprenyl-diphosphatase